MIKKDFEKNNSRVNDTLVVGKKLVTKELVVSRNVTASGSIQTKELKVDDLLVGNKIEASEVDVTGNIIATGTISAANFPGPIPSPVYTFYGLNLSRVTGTVLSVTSGSASIQNGSSIYEATLTTFKSINLQTNGVNGLDTGVLVANRWYSVYLIANTSTNTVATIVSFGAPLLPPGFNITRRIGSVYSNASAQIEPFFQTGSGPDKTYIWSDPLTSHVFLTNGTATSFGTAGFTTSSFAGATPFASQISVKATFTTANPTGGSFSIYSSPSGAETATFGVTSATTLSFAPIQTVITITGTVGYSVASGTVTLSIIGWIESL